MRKQVEVITEERRFIDCPKCGKHRFGIPSKNFGERSYFCIHCGKAINVTCENGEVFIDDSDEFENRTLVFLRYEDMLLVVEGVIFNGDLEEDDSLYNMHMCPTTYFRTALAVVDLRDRDTDPHGMFEYITTVPIRHDQFSIFDKDELELEELEELTGLRFEELNT